MFVWVSFVSFTAIVNKKKCFKKQWEGNIFGVKGKEWSFDRIGGFWHKNIKTVFANICQFFIANLMMVIDRR